MEDKKAEPNLDTDVYTVSSAPLPTEDDIENFKPGEARRMLVNILLISFAFTLFFTAVTGMGNLQSSINSEDGLGTYSSSAAYTALVLSCLFIPSWLIERLSVKWALVLGLSGSTCYIIAQFYPTFATMIPAALITGFSSSYLWSAKCTYFTHVGHLYARLLKTTPQLIIARFFGIFFFSFQTAELFGNLISSTILSKSKSKNDTDISVCGASFCPSDIRDTIEVQKPPKSQIYMLASVYVAFCLAAIGVIVLFVDPLTRYGEKTRHTDKSMLTTKSLLLATARQMKNPLQILIIPLTMWSGLEQAFTSSAFTQAFISCAWGVDKVGYVMMCYGICNSCSSLFFGYTVRYLGRAPIFIFGACLNIGVIITYFKWQPDPENTMWFFIIGGLWGIGDGIWQTQINALYGVLFVQNEEAAFSNYRLWESVGFIIAFTTAHNVCVAIKLYILLTTITVGIIGYIIIEVIIRQNLGNIGHGHVKNRE